MELIINWLFNSCRFGHRWANRKGSLRRIRSAERVGSGEMLVKNPDGGWLRFERRCGRPGCGYRQYLKQLNTAGTKGKWVDL